VRIVNARRRLRFGWPARVGLLAAGVAAVIGLAGSAQAALTTVSPTPDDTYTFDGYVRAVAYLGNTIYLGGDFANAIYKGKKTPRTRLAAIDATTGALLPWAPVADGSVVGIAVDAASNSVYPTGKFVHINGKTRDALAQIDATTGALGGFKHTISGTTRAVAIGNGRIYLGGKLTAIDGIAISNIVAFNLGTAAVDPGFAVTTDNRVNTLSYTATRLYLGGIYTTVNGSTSYPRLTAVNPTTGVLDTTFKPSPKAPVEVIGIGVGPSGVYAAMAGSGGRTNGYTMGGTFQWQATTDGNAQAVTYFNGVVYIGGHFDNVCKTVNVQPTGGGCIDGSTPRGKMMAVDPATGTLLGWNPGADGIQGVDALVVNPTLNKLAASGSWAYMSGVWHPNFAQFGF
jgi:hypothetical protein